MEPGKAFPEPAGAGSPTKRQFRLVLDEPNKLYLPGDPVTGLFDGWSRRDGSQVHVILEGRAKAYIVSRGTHQEVRYANRCPLLYLPHLIRKDSDRNGIPCFSIKIPDKVQADLSQLDKLTEESGYWTHDWKPVEGFESEAGHPLPPSMVMSSSQTHNVTDRVTGHGYIEYKLTATRSRFAKDGDVLIEAISQVRIWVSAKSIQSDKLHKLLAMRQGWTTDKVSIHSVQLNPTVAARRLTIKERFLDVLQLPSIPTFTFAAMVSLPKVATVGGQLPLSVQLTPLPQLGAGAYNFPLPDITLTSMDIKLKHLQGVRVKAHMAPGDHSYKFKVTERHFSKTQSETFIAKDGSYKEQTYSITLDLPDTLLADYKTFNFWRAHVVKCRMTFRCATKEASAEFSIPVEIVPKSRPHNEVEIDSTLRGYLSQHQIEKEDEFGSLKMATSMLRDLNARLLKKRSTAKTSVQTVTKETE